MNIDGRCDWSCKQSVRSVGDSAWFLILAHSYGCTSDALGCWRQKGTAPREQRSGVARRWATTGMEPWKGLRNTESCQSQEERERFWRFLGRFFWNSSGKGPYCRLQLRHSVTLRAPSHQPGSDRLQWKVARWGLLSCAASWQQPVAKSAWSCPGCSWYIAPSSLKASSVKCMTIF